MTTNDEKIKQVYDDIKKEDKLRNLLIKKTLWLIDELTQKNYDASDIWIRQINENFDELKQIIKI